MITGYYNRAVAAGIIHIKKTITAIRRREGQAQQASFATRADTSYREKIAQCIKLLIINFDRAALLHNKDPLASIIGIYKIDRRAEACDRRGKY